MNLNSISNYFSDNTASLVSSVPQASSAATGQSVSGVTGQGSDNSHLSPFAQLLSTLQQLQQSSPAQYRQVTQQIAAGLTTAAATATKNGNTAEASQLTSLAKDFTSASQSGQLPNVQELASAIGGGGHHHHVHGSSAHSESSASTSASASSASQTLAQLQTAFQPATTGDSATDSMSIIMNALSNAGITASTS